MYVVKKYRGFWICVTMAIVKASDDSTVQNASFTLLPVNLTSPFSDTNIPLNMHLKSVYIFGASEYEMKVDRLTVDGMLDEQEVDQCATGGNGVESRRSR